MIQPVYSGYFADPFAWLHEGVYYAVGTGEEEASGEVPGRSHVTPLLRSHDLQNWEYVRHALIHPGPELGEQFWAPEVARGDDGLFYMYYSVGLYEQGVDHHLRVAISDRPDGPYEDSGVALLMPNVEENFVFDPHPFREENGDWYLFYNRNHFEVSQDELGTLHAGDTISARKLVTMTSLSDDPVQILRPRHDWQRSPRRGEGEHAGIDWHTTEGACVVKRLGRYWCLYSGAAWFTDRYGVDWATSESLLGPYHADYRPDDDPPRILKAGSYGLRGPGHNSVVTGPDGVERIVFHAWDEGLTKRQMFVMPLEWTDEGPRVIP
jgi:GH43 family beta-xylosidase